VQVHENVKKHCKDKGVHLKEKAGKDNEGKMAVHKELDALIVELDTSQEYAAAAAPKFAALIANSQVSYYLPQMHHYPVDLIKDFRSEREAQFQAFLNRYFQRQIYP